MDHMLYLYVETQFFTSYGAQSENRQKNFRPPTPLREEAAQARWLDARRTLSIWERQQGSFRGHVERM